MSIKRPCCFCYTVAPAFVFPACARLRAGICWWINRAFDLPLLLWKWPQWPATAKLCKDKLLCNAFWQMRLSWVVLLLIYRADASRSWAVGRQKFTEFLLDLSCGILIESVEQRQRKQMLLELPLTWKGLSPHQPRTTGKRFVTTCRGRSAWRLFVYCTSPHASEDWFVSICHRRFHLEPWRNTPRCSAELWPRSTRKNVSSSLSLTPF